MRGCTGFVNYQTGDYQINFTTAPASGASIIATWTNIISPEIVAAAATSKPQNVDFFGDGTCQSGADSAMFCKAPGGVDGHIFSGYGTDKGYMMNSAAPSNVGYQFGGIGYSQMISFLYGTKFPALVPGASASVPFMTTGQWRIEGPSLFSSPTLAFDGVHDQWTQDIATKSTFSGTIASNILTLTTNAVGPMWEGEIVNCAPVTTNCTNGPLSGVYITSLASGAWGVSGSTYDLAGSPANVSVASAMQNPVYYSGAGSAYYLGTLNDIIVQTTGACRNDWPHSTSFERVHRRPARDLALGGDDLWREWRQCKRPESRSGQGRRFRLRLVVHRRSMLRRRVDLPSVASPRRGLATPSPFRAA